MAQARTVLVVAATPALIERLVPAVRAAGQRPMVADTFATAKAHLDQSPAPHLVISEIKLGPHNGLHLAVRSQALGIPAIVVGEKEFEREAEQLGALWLSHDVDGQLLQAAIARVVPGVTPCSQPEPFPLQ